MRTDARPSKSGWPKLPIQGLLNWRAKDFKAVWSAFLVKQSRERPSIPRRLPTGGHGNATHLQKCCERALDAYTVEDAIFWHSEVINELSVEIYSMASTSLSDARKARALADLTDLQNRHGAILNRLTGIVARNEQLVWQPASICRK